MGNTIRITPCNRRVVTPPPPDPLADFPDVLKVKEAARVVRMSERALYEALRRGEFPAQKVRGAWRVPKVLLAKWLSGEWKPERKAA